MELTTGMIELSWHQFESNEVDRKGESNRWSSVGYLDKAVKCIFNVDYELTDF